MKIKLALASFFVILFLMVAQAIRWYKMDTPIVWNETIEGKTISFNELKRKYPNQEFKDKYRYFRHVEIQYSREQWVFPFTCVKADTLLDKINHSLF